MRKNYLLTLALLGCWGLFVGSALAAEVSGYRLSERPGISIGLGFDYETGDYGSDSRSEFISVPLYLDLYPTDRLDLELIVPYLYQSREAGDAASILYRTQGGGGVGARRGGQTSTTAASTALLSSHGRRSESGLGDITLTAGYVVLEDGQGTPQLRPTFYLKFPTADKDQGLGTGEFDFGPGLSLSKWLGDWHLFAEGSYVFQGESQLYATKDYFSYNAGVGRQMRESFYGALQARGASAPANGAEDSLDGRLKGVWRLAPDISLEGSVGAGLADGSADFSSSLAVFFDF